MTVRPILGSYSEISSGKCSYAADFFTKIHRLGGYAFSSGATITMPEVLPVLQLECPLAVPYLLSVLWRFLIYFSVFTLRPSLLPLS